MIVTLIEIVLWGSLAIYLIVWRFEVRRQQAQAWERLVDQLQPHGNASELRSFLLDERNDTPEMRWHRIQGANGLWSMYENARIMLEMANYAAANSAEIDRELLDALRRDAMQIRVCVLIELSRQAYSQVHEGTRGNVERAAVAYSDMVSRMAGLLQANQGVLVSGFAPVM